MSHLKCTTNLGCYFRLVLNYTGAHNGTVMGGGRVVEVVTTVTEPGISKIHTSAESKTEFCKGPGTTYVQDMKFL